jgi:hypothetical protein
MSNFLLVVGNDGVLTTQDTFIRDRLVGQGHTVTIIDDGAAAPVALNTTYNAVVMSNTANINQITTKYDATTRGVLSFFPWPHSQFTIQASPSNGTSIVNQYVFAAGGDSITPTGSGTNVQYLSSAATYTYIDDNGTSLGPGYVKFLTGRNDLPARATGVRYLAGATMTASAVAPSRRIRMGFSDLTFLNATGLTWFDNAVTWVLTPLAPVANAGPDQAVAANATVTLDGSASTSGGTITSYNWSQTSGTTVTLANATSAHPTFTSPTSLSPSTLIFSLTVTDSNSATSAADSVTVTVSARATIKIRQSGSWVVRPLKARVAGAWKD